MLVGVTDPNSKGKLDYHSIIDIRKRMSGIQEIPWGCPQLKLMENYNTQFQQDY